LAQIKCKKRKVLEPMAIMISPYAPHLGEEIWNKLGKKNSIVHAKFPTLDSSYLIEDAFEYPVSVNGKMRANLSFPIDTPMKVVEQKVLNHDIIKKWLDGKTPKKVIIVHKKIINVVL
jgi:leucyl-tRNA synthetase